MFFKSFIKTLSTSNSIFNNNSFDKVNPGLIKYFRTEYGADWKAALEQHLYKESIKNDKKAA